MTANPQRTSAPTPDTEQKRFLNLARRVAETIGAEFFSVLVNQLGRVLGAECVYVGEFVLGRTERVQTLAAYMREGQADTLDRPLAGSPDAEVADGKPCLHARGVQEAFPGDRWVRNLEAAAYVGVPLHNPE